MCLSVSSLSQRFRRYPERTTSFTGCTTAGNKIHGTPSVVSESFHGEPGRGTTLKIYRPRGKTTLPARLREGRSGRPSGTETLLLVEDEDAVRTLLRYILQMIGYTVLEARRADEAIRRCEQHSGPIHLLVADVVLPGRGGRELADHLLVLRPGTKVLFVSGYPDETVVRHGVLVEQVAFLQKPFTVDALAGKVRAVLDATPRK
jgi:two-component system, cell cycle sensor histidine kinase and response regulator CckA